MRYYYKFWVIWLLILFTFIPESIHASGTGKITNETVRVKIYITDNNGYAISDAKMMIGENFIHVVKEKDGYYEFAVNPNDIVTISAVGYITDVLSGQDVINNNNVGLERTANYSSPDDNMPLPYMTIKRRHATGSYNVIKGEDLLNYPSTDLRSSFIGKVPGIMVNENHGAPGSHPAELRGFYGVSAKTNVTSRGSNLMYVIDGIPANVSEIPLDPGEIETVTVIKDIVGKTMFGPLGADGIMYIRTRRGTSEKSILNVSIENGMSEIDRFPEWVAGADYARLNNQARESNGRNPLYSQADIAAYENNDPYNLKHPNVNYRDYMLKNDRIFQRANISARGGSESARYSSYIGFNREGDIFSIGSTADYNRLNVRSNLDIEINDHISTELDINGTLGLRRTPGYGYTTGEGQELMGIYEFNTALPHILLTPPVEFPVYAKNDPELSQPWYGISSRYANPVGNLLGSGDYTEQNRQAGVKFSINYNLSQLVKGLTTRSSIGFDALNLIRIGQANRYEGYRINVGENDITFTRLQTGISDDTRRKLHDYYYIRTAFSQSLNYSASVAKHGIQSSLTYFFYRKFSDNTRDPEPHLLGVWNGKYVYNDRFTIHGVVNYAHTYSFLKENRGGIFPAVGAGWVISEGRKFLSYLKLRAEMGIIGYDPYLDPHIVRSRFASTTRSSFGPHSLNRWFGTSVETSPPSTYPTWIGNADLTWEKREEFNLGLEGSILNNSIFLEVNYFNTFHNGVIGRLTNSLPSVTGMSAALPYINHDQYRYEGIEAGLQLVENIGKFYFSIGGNATVQRSEIVKYDEPNYRYEYQFRTGQPVDTYWGLNYIGRFSNDEEALVIPQLFDPVLHEGDLKYEDKNGDGVIDENDYSAIGNLSPRVFYALNLNFKYNNFEISAIGTGAALFDIPLTSAYFQNGWGDNNYSVFVRDNIGEAYPKLTYERINNNFQASNFWLTKGDFLKIKNAEFAYTIPGRRLQIIKATGMRIFVRGSNLLTISSVKDIDPESPTSGITSYPLYKTYTAGVSLTF